MLNKLCPNTFDIEFTNDRSMMPKLNTMYKKMFMAMSIISCQG